MRFSSIVIAGGALKVVSVTGCIKYLEEKDMINDLKTFVGSSAGSMLCLALVLGFSFVQIIEFLGHNLFHESVASLDAEECMNIFTTFGLTSGQAVVVLLEKMLQMKLGVQDITFMDLAKVTGKNLVVCVSNLTRERHEFMSLDTTPGMSVVLAIKMSCALPILMTPVVFNGDLYVDGGVYNNFPMDYFKASFLQDILGINLEVERKTPENFLSYISFLFYKMLDKNKVLNDNKKNVVTLHLQEEEWFSLTEMSLQFPKDYWIKYIAQGYKRIKEFLEQNSRSSQDPPANHGCQ